MTNSFTSVVTSLTGGRRNLGIKKNLKKKKRKKEKKNAGQKHKFILQVFFACTSVCVGVNGVKKKMTLKDL